MSLGCVVKTHCDGGPLKGFVRMGKSFSMEDLFIIQSLGRITSFFLFMQQGFQMEEEGQWVPRLRFQHHFHHCYQEECQVGREALARVASR